MDALMPIDDQALQMLRELAQQLTAMQQHFNATIRSLTESINKNAVTNEQRLTAVERDLAGHVLLDEQKHKRSEERLADHSGEFEALAVEVGKNVASLEQRMDRTDAVIVEVKDLISQGKGVGKGARLVWQIVAAIALAISTVLGWLQIKPKG